MKRLCVSLLVIFPLWAFALNESFTEQIKMGNVTGVGNPRFFSSYAPPDIFLRKQLETFLIANNYLAPSQAGNVELVAHIQKFDWDVTLGTFTVGIEVQYTIKGSGYTKIFQTNSISKASFSDFAMGSDRNAFVMRKVAEDSVNKFSNFLETYIPVKNEITNNSVVENTNIQIIPKIPSDGNLGIEKAGNSFIHRNERLSLDAAKSKCAELGFKTATEGYGKCVLQLSK